MQRKRYGTLSMSVGHSQNEYYVIGINIFDFIEKQSLALFYDHARY